MTKSIKRIFLILCSALCLLAMGMAIVSMPKKTAHAADTGAATYGLTLNDRVALRIYGSGGVRFSGSIKDANTVDEYGIILADEVTYHKNGELTMEKKNAVASSNGNGLTITKSGDKTNFSVALYGIKEKNIARNYVARGYVWVDGTYYYTDEVRANPYELAKLAYVENGITDNEVINDYLQRVVDVTVDENNTVSVNSPLADLTLLTDTISYDADQTLGWAGIDKQVAALYINGTKVAAAYTDLALSTWGNVEVTMDGAGAAYDALLNVNGASFESGSVTFDVSSVLPKEKMTWLDGVNGSTNIQYLQSAYSESAKSVALSSGEQTVSLPVTDYDNAIRGFGANYLRIRLALGKVGQTLRVNGLNNDQDYKISASKIGENILLSMNKSNELYAMYTATGESVYLGNIPQSVFFGESALSMTVNSTSSASIEISPYFLSTSDKFNSIDDAVLSDDNLLISGGESAPDSALTFVESDGVFTQSIGAGYEVYVQQIKQPQGGLGVSWKYWRILIGGYQYTDYSSVTFYISGNVKGYKYYNEKGQPLFTVDGMTKVTIANDGTVWANGVQSENKMDSNGIIVFHLETKSQHQQVGSGADYGEFHISDFIVLGDKAATVGVINEANISTGGINALNDASTTYSNYSGQIRTSTNNRIDFSGGYGAYIQDIKVDGAGQWHRYFKLTLNKDYRNYDSLSFYLWSNTGNKKLTVGGRNIGTMPQKETVKITVLGDGEVLVNDAATGAYMEDGVTAVYIDTNRTESTYYGEIYVGKAVFINGVVDTITPSSLTLEGVDAPEADAIPSYETPKTDTEYEATGYGVKEFTNTYSGDVRLLALYAPGAKIDGTTYGWRYFRMNFGFGFRNHNSTSFYWVNDNGRDVATDVYLQDGTLLTSIYPKILTKFTIDREGYVYINDNTLAAGQIKTEQPIFYLDTNSKWHNNTTDEYYGTFQLSNVTQDGQINYWLDVPNYTTIYSIKAVAEESFPMPLNKDAISSGTFWADGGESITNAAGETITVNVSSAANSNAYGGEAMYYRAIFNYMGLNYLQNTSTEFYVSANYVDVEYYVNGILLKKIAKNEALKIKIDQKGLVYVNDSASFITKVNGTFAIEAKIPANSPYCVFKVSQNIWVNGTATALAASNLKLVKVSALSVMPTLASSVKEVEMAPADVPTWEVRTDAPAIGNGYWVDLDQKLDGTRICWSYWRFAMNLNYKLYDSVSFQISARLTTFDVYMYQKKLVSIPAYQAVRFTVDGEGNVYVGDSTEIAATLKGDNIVFDLDIHHEAHGTENNNFYGIRLSVGDTVTTNEGNLTVRENYFSVGAVAEDVVIYKENTYGVHTGGGAFDKTTTDIVADNTVTFDGYTAELGTVNGEAWSGYEITVNNPQNYEKVTLHLNASEVADLYVNNRLVATLKANTWQSITLDASGNVVLRLDTRGKTLTLTTLAFAGGNLGAERIDLSGNISVKAVAFGSILASEWKDEGDSWSYDYQQVGTESTVEKAPVTLSYSYTGYSKVSFTLSSNVDGISVYTSKNGAPVYDLTANTAVNFTVNNQGYLFADGTQVGRLTTSSTTLYIGIREIIATDYDYYTIFVGKNIFLSGSSSVVGDNVVGVGVTEDNIVEDGVSNYVILKGTSDEYTNFAVQEVQSVIEDATGVKLPIATALSDQTADNNYILIGGNTIPTAVEKDDNPMDKFWNYGTVTQGTVTEEERKLMGINRTLSYSYTGDWNRVNFDAVDLTSHDEWLFYARNDTVGAELALFADGGNPNYAISYLDTAGWHEFRLVRNPSGSYGNNTYNVYCNGKIQVHPAWETVERKVVEINGNTNELWWISTSAKISYSALYAVERTPVKGADTALMGLGHGGYALKTLDKNIHVLSNSTVGGMSGALDMLGYMVNYEAYAGDAVYYDTGISTLPVQAFDHTFKPLIDERHLGHQSVSTSDDDRLRLKLQESGDEWASWTHTTASQYLKVSDYGPSYAVTSSGSDLGTVTFDSATFASKMISARPADGTTYKFQYSGSALGWRYNNQTVDLADYGIWYTGSADWLNSITVTYSAGAHADWYNIAGNQICYGTALNDLTTEGGMYQTFLSNVKSQLKDYFLIEQYAGNKSVFVSLAHEDNDMYCNCDKCMAIMNVYGGVEGGGYAAMELLFANNIAKDINAWLPTVGLGDKHLKYTILAYGRLGREVPTANIELHEDVYVMVAPIESFYNVDIYNEANSAVYERLKGWNAYINTNSQEDHLIVYNYNLNGMCYLFPTNNVAAGSFYDAFADNGVSYVYTQGVNASPTASFEALRIYLEAKQMYDSKYSREELIKNFMLNYYDDAKNPTGSGEIMLKFYNELENYYAYLSRTTYDMYKNGTGTADTNGNGFNGYWHCDMFGPLDTSRASGSAPTYWTTAKLQGFISQINAAVAAINASGLDAAAKATLTERVERELIFPMFVSVAMSYSNYYDRKVNGDSFYDFDVKLTATEKANYVTKLQSLTEAIGLDKIFEASSLLWRNGLGIDGNSLSAYFNTLINTGSNWYTKAD